MFNLFGKSANENLNAVEMLKEDHARVKELFKTFKDVEDGEDLEVIDVVTTACLELMVHSKLEEQVFYPALHEKKDEELEKLLGEAEIEHKSIDTLVEKLLTTGLDDQAYKANFKVVMDYVEHHVKEEEDEMFPLVEDLDINLDTLGAKMRARQAELVEDIAADPTIAVGRGQSKGTPGASARV